MLTVWEIKEHHRNPKCGCGVAELVACQIQSLRKAHYVRVLEAASQHNLPMHEGTDHITHIEQNLVSTDGRTTALAYLKQK